MLISDWSSDVCSSDLRSVSAPTAHRPVRSDLAHARFGPGLFGSGPTGLVPTGLVLTGLALGACSPAPAAGPKLDPETARPAERKSVVKGKRVSVRVVLVGRQSITKKSNIAIKE